MTDYLFHKIKNERNDMENNTVEKVKLLFREWYGSLSVEELVTNYELIELIKKIESHLNKVNYLEVSYEY
jgi:hypothetical protein